MPQKHEIKINLPGLLRMLGENIYAEPDVAIREMIQNAHDTCIIRGTRDSGYKNPQIHLTFDRAAQTLTIADNGAGMVEKDLHNSLSTIGESFTRIQKDQLREKDARKAALLIGQFGIGLLSAFSISAEVEVITRSYQGTAAFRWRCKGDIHYEMELCEKADAGTRVVLHILDSKLELLDETRLRQAIKKYADFLSIPIFLNGTQANACTPPWENGNTDLAEYIQSALLPKSPSRLTNFVLWTCLAASKAVRRGNGRLATTAAAWPRPPCSASSNSLAYACGRGAEITKRRKCTPVSRSSTA
jgi:molecular chaperone HtpG